MAEKKELIRKLAYTYLYVGYVFVFSFFVFQHQVLHKDIGLLVVLLQTLIFLIIYIILNHLIIKVVTGHKVLFLIEGLLILSLFTQFTCYGCIWGHYSR